jgi:pimeloyl-ACP methyl ester carboxylesterase
MEMRMIAGGGGVQLAVFEAGLSDGPALFFVHGFSQSHAAWSEQLQSELAVRFRLVALDLRGHGESGKPVDRYADGGLWADDIRAIIESLGLDRPFLVCWSYGGVVACDYLRRFGEEDIGGIVLVGAISKVGSGLAPDLGDELPPLVAGLLSDDPQVGLPAIESFVELCFERRPDAHEVARIVSYNAAVPAHVRQSLFAREVSNDDILAKLTKPVLIIHGEKDRVIKTTAAIDHTNVIPHAHLVLLPGIGHSPFHEDPARFNAELASFCAGLNSPPDSGGVGKQPAASRPT